MAHSDERIDSARGLAGNTPRQEGDAPATAPPSTGFKLTQTLVILAALALIVAGGLLWLQLFVAERLPEMTEARFEAAEALWTTSGPTSYNMDLEIRGAQPGTVHIEVRDGTPTAMQRDDMAPPERTWGTWTVPGMFQTLVEEFAIAEDPTHKGQGAPGAKVWLRCQFDPKYGYPAIYQRLMTGGGPEVYWRVTKFEPQ